MNRGDMEDIKRIHVYINMASNLLSSLYYIHMNKDEHLPAEVEDIWRDISHVFSKLSYYIKSNEPIEEGNQ